MVLYNLYHLVVGRHSRDGGKQGVLDHFLNRFSLKAVLTFDEMFKLCKLSEAGKTQKSKKQQPNEIIIKCWSVSLVDLFG